MAVTKDGKFILEPRHFYEGLTSEDFSAYAGFHIPVFYLGQLPHWDKWQGLQRPTKQELGQRTQAILSALEQDDVFMRRSKTLNYQPDFDSIRHSTALKPSPCVMYINAGLSHVENQETIFDKISFGGLDAINQRYAITAPEELGTINYVRTGAPYGNYKIDLCKATLNAYAIIPSVDDTSPSYWAMKNCLPPSYSARIPKNNILHLIDGLHEMRHTVQAEEIPLTIVHKYYRELDADLFSHYTIRTSDPANPRIFEESLMADRHIGYINIMLLPFNCWTAPALDALESGQRLPHHAAIKSAGEEICCRILEIIHRKPFDLTSCSQTPEYRKWALENILSQPEKGYSMIKVLADHNAFTQPMAQQIAQKIVAAAEYFCPGITTGTKPDARGVYNINRFSDNRRTFG